MKNHRAYGKMQLEHKNEKLPQWHIKKIRHEYKMVVHFRTCETIKKCVKTSVNTVFSLEKDLLFTCGSGLWKGCLLLVSCGGVEGRPPEILWKVVPPEGVAQGEWRSLEEVCAFLPLVFSYLALFSWGQMCVWSFGAPQGRNRCVSKHKTTLCSHCSLIY